MNYCNVLEDLLKEVSKRDFERPVLERLFPVFLKPALPLDLPLVYDKAIFPAFKAFLLGKRDLYLQKPCVFHSLLKEMKGVFLGKEYKELKRILNEGELKLVLDEGSDKLNSLKFKGVENPEIERITHFFTTISKNDMESTKTYLKQTGFMKRTEATDHRGFANPNGVLFNDYIDELFKTYYSGLSRFPTNLQPLALQTIDTLSFFKLIPEAQKDKFHNRSSKYLRQVEEQRKKIKTGGEILLLEYEALELNMSKEEKQAKLAQFERLRQIIEGFPFAKLDISTPSFIYFGSFKSGFATKGSDIDTTLLTNGAFNERELLFIGVFKGI